MNLTEALNDLENNDNQGSLILNKKTYRNSNFIRKYKKWTGETLNLEKIVKNVYKTLLNHQKRGFIANLDFQENNSFLLATWDIL